MAARRSRAARALLALLVVCAPGRVSQGWGPATAHAWAPREVLSTNDLSMNAYPAVTHVPCVLLLNATGSVGCSTNAGGVTAPVRRFESAADVRSRLKSRTILLLPASAFPEVLSDFAKGESRWKTHAAGFMLEPGVDADGNFPSADFDREPSIRSEPGGSDGHAPSTSGATLARLLAGIRLGQNRTFSPQPKRGDEDLRSLRVWNPGGFGAAYMRFENTPIVLLDAAGADVARTFAAANGERGTSRVAEMRFPMAAAAAAATTEKNANPAKRCLEQRTCQPIGGHSVVASVPASLEHTLSTKNSQSSVREESDETVDDGSRRLTDNRGNKKKRDYLLVSARLDATALFHDAAFGANAAMSGLVAMLAIAKTYADAIRDARASLASLEFSTSTSSDDDENAPPRLSSETFERALREDAAPVAFAAFGAESWGRAGSRRFARLVRDATKALARLDESDANRGSDTSGASFANVDALPLWMRDRSVGGVVDLGAVGFTHFTTEPTVFAHANEEARGDTRDDLRDKSSSFPLVDSIEESFAKEDASGAANASRRLSFARASANVSELPPSSASSFIGNAVPAVVLAEYDGAYVDGTFGSAFDVGMEKVDVQKMASLVSGTARALASLAFSSSRSADAKTNETHDDDDASSSLSALHALVKENLPDFDAVEETTRSLAECLIDPKVGFECALAKKMAFEPQETFPSRYAGVAPITIGKRGFDAETDGVVGAGADDVARFVFEFLAEATSEIRGDPRASSCASPDACGDGEVCARASGDVPGDVPGDEGDGDDENEVRREPRRALLGSDAFGGGGGGGAGTCVKTSARFLPALSHRIFFDDDENGWTVSDADFDDENLNEDPDPLWCESDWPMSIGVRVFREASLTHEWIALLLGAAVTFLSKLFANELDAIAKTRFKEE
jgi:nicastrin